MSEKIVTMQQQKTLMVIDVNGYETKQCLKSTVQKIRCHYISLQLRQQYLEKEILLS